MHTCIKSISVQWKYLIPIILMSSLGEFKTLVIRLQSPNIFEICKRKINCMNTFMLEPELSVYKEATFHVCSNLLKVPLRNSFLLLIICNLLLPFVGLFPTALHGYIKLVHGYIKLVLFGPYMDIHHSCVWIKFYNDVRLVWEVRLSRPVLQVYEVRPWFETLITMINTLPCSPECQVTILAQICACEC